MRASAATRAIKPGQADTRKLTVQVMHLGSYTFAKVVYSRARARARAADNSEQRARAVKFRIWSVAWSDQHLACAGKDAKVRIYDIQQDTGPAAVRTGTSRESDER